ncbi:MAG: SHOCT domain-containing protein [Acidimicrobiia bacterium]|nr:SHOCT domain-containing protein [Acidimicrobiia bacterium]
MPMRRGGGLIGTAARTAVIAGTASAVGGRVRNRQYTKAAQAQADAEAQAAPPVAAAPPPPPPAPAPATGGSDVVAELKQLAELHSAGALTDEQFEAAKAKLLA